MNHKRIIQIAVFVIGVLLIGGAILLGWLVATEDERNVMKVDLESEVAKPIRFESLHLIPGESCEYTVTLSGERTKDYDVHLDFIETEDKKLKEYARVKVVANGEVVCDELLARAFERDDIGLSVNFEKEKNIELTVTFYLPLEIGNEAKNAEAKFDLLITAGNE